MEMKTISLTPTESVPIRELAKALATKALELLTSQRLNIALGLAALAALIGWHATGLHPLRTAALTLAWAAQLALCITVDIAKGGDDL